MKKKIMANTYICICIIPGKNFKNDGNQKIAVADKANLSLDFGPVLQFYTFLMLRKLMTEDYASEGHFILSWKLTETMKRKITGNIKL